MCSNRVPIESWKHAGFFDFSDWKFYQNQSPKAINQSGIPSLFLRHQILSVADQIWRETWNVKAFLYLLNIFRSIIITEAVFWMINERGVFYPL
jgi:hypothetical protein